MEHITFIDLNSATCRMGIGKNTVRVRIENKDKRIVFNRSITKELAKLRPTHCNVGVGDDSKSLYFIFNKSKGFGITAPTADQTFSLRGKLLIDFIQNHFNLKKDAELDISDNMANGGDYATYRISLSSEAVAMTVDSSKKQERKEVKKEKKEDIPPYENNKKVFDSLGASVKDVLELSGTELEDINIQLDGGIKNTINKYGTLGKVYVSDPEELIRKERGIGKRKVLFLKSLFKAIGLNWGN